MNLTVEQNDDDILFSAPANETADLTDWVCLGTYASGAEVELSLTLDVPVEMDNTFQNAVGSLSWEFKVEEIPTEGQPDTDDNLGMLLYVGIGFIVIAAVLIVFFVFKKKKEQKLEK